MTNEPGQSHSFNRRRFLQAAGAAALAAGCGRTPRTNDGPLERMIVLGIYGMDPQLLKQFIAEGRMPNCKRLIERGSFHELATSNPPQSPVAWSNFISGTNSGGHGIFDFISRDPETMKLFHSTTKLVSGGEPIKVGKYVIPTGAGHIENLRHGPTFWDELERAGVDCTILRIPANFPPTGEEATSLSGMGTPDIQGGYGIFTWFTDDIKARSRDVSGGRIERMPFKNHIADCRLYGPPNEFLAGSPRAELHFKVYRDPERDAAKIVIGDQAIVLQQGEWSDWVVVRFTLLPYAAEVSGICRLYLKSVHRPFGLYVSPVNIDPADPSVPISTPPDYSKRLVKELGYFYTQGMIEDTHALSQGILDNNEYREQAMFVHEERMRFFEHELARFTGGFLFFYFSSLDLSSHMFWRTMDPLHPLYSEELAKTQGDFLAELYGKVDRAIGLALDRFDKNSWVMVMSDHGFTSFRRQFNLNSWLLDQGYLRTKGQAKRDGSTLFEGVDWERTLAYGVGLNGLYLNIKGREAYGKVNPGNEANNLANELATRLEQVKDPDNDEAVILKVHRSREIYQGPYADTGPDLIIGYNRYYRASWDTILGGFPREHVLDNTDNWSGDHCIDPSFVPGVLLSNRPLQGMYPRLEDLAPTILAGFDIKAPEGMTGKSLY
ncbi:MAG: alkaline phosphatase family protein [Planctomycetota bacterium]|nr:alkaline phosphatase family protein [Planctomycetota bacterium]